MLRFSRNSKITKEKGEKDVNFIIGKYEHMDLEAIEMPLARSRSNDRFDQANLNTIEDNQPTEVIPDEEAIDLAEIGDVQGLEEVKSFGEGGICVICFTEEPDSVFMRCGHGGNGIFWLLNYRSVLFVRHGHLGEIELLLPLQRSKLQQPNS